MKQIFPIICILALLSTIGCSSNDRISWQITLEKDDKQPYGSYLAFQSLKYYFPNAEIETLSKGYRYTAMGKSNGREDDKKKLLILLGLDLTVSESELDSLITFTQQGNEVLVFCSQLDEKIENRLGCYKQAGGLEEAKLSEFNTGKQNLNALKLQDHPGRSFGYEGRSLAGYFRLKKTKIDTNVTLNSPISIMPDTLGLRHNAPNFVKYRLGKGHMTLHAAPLVMSNYFLLQESNRQYLDGIWRLMPGDINTVYWNEYFKHSGEGSNLSVLLKYPATRWAVIVAALTLLLYVVFESKRRQRIIVAIAQPENSSVSFVETVGRLYYNTGDHSSIAEKMIQHFLEWVRIHYYLNTSELNAHFAAQLANKSGIALIDSENLVKTINDIRIKNIAIDEITLITLHQRFDQLYHNHNAKNGHTRYQRTSTY